jgi:hypothetical protein
VLTLAIAETLTQPSELWAGLGALTALRIVRKTVDQAMIDAQRFEGQGRYAVGGGADIYSPTPFDESGTADCSAYTSWVTGHSRRQPWGTYNTTNMVRDAFDISSSGTVRGVGPRLLYDPVAYASGSQSLSLSRVQPGDLIVRPWIGETIGHSGFVLAVREPPTSRWHENLVIAQMGLSAVTIGNASAWKDRAVFIIRPRYYRPRSRLASAGGGGVLVAAGIAAALGGYAYYRYSRRGRIWG